LARWPNHFASANLAHNFTGPAPHSSLPAQDRRHNVALDMRPGVPAPKNLTNQTRAKALQFLLMTPKPKSSPAPDAAVKATASTKPGKAAKVKGPLTLCIDIGGSGLKAMVVDANGTPVS
jgi:hypothetical protein